MKEDNIQIGMKVVPFQKTVLGWGRLHNSEVWETAIKKDQKYLYVVGKNNKNDCYILNDELDLDNIDGDYFNPEDFEPYV